MSQEQSGKSRRRFLADMLFLGGGVTAAALLAKSGFGTDTPPTPAPAPPPPPPPEHEPVPKGEVFMSEGETSLPEVPCVDDSPAQPRPVPPPQVEGRVALPQQTKGPNPAGGMVVPPRSDGP